MYILMYVERKGYLHKKKKTFMNTAKNSTKSKSFFLENITLYTFDGNNKSYFLL